ncbi:MAG: hypothetical protein U0360_05865 [Dehalococcoidia bacterium]
MTLTVSDGTQTAFDSLMVSVGNAPTITSLTPADGTLFRAGDHIVISGDAIDTEDGVLPDSAFSWSIVFRHDGHVHPGAGPINGVRSFAFDIPTTGHDYSGNTRYEVILTVTDSNGLVKTGSFLLLPDKVNLSFSTAPAGLNLTVDGIVKTTPFVLDEVKGFQFTVGAAAQVSGSAAYAFASWSDGGAASHVITAPLAPASYLATFTATQGTPGLVAEYGFNEGAGGAVTDSSIFGNNGTIENATWITAGKYGGALNFDGSTARVRIPDAASLDLTSALTLEAWVRPAATQTGWRTVIQKQPDSYLLAGGSAVGSLRPAGGVTIGTTTPTASATSSTPVGAWRTWR